jgi:hypothetical protein
MILCCGSQLFIILKMLLIMRRISQRQVFLDDYQSSTSVVTSPWNWPALWNLVCNEVSWACSWILNDVSHMSVQESLALNSVKWDPEKLLDNFQDCDTWMHYLLLETRLCDFRFNWTEITQCVLSLKPEMFNIVLQLSTAYLYRAFIWIWNCVLILAAHSRSPAKKSKPMFVG